MAFPFAAMGIGALIGGLTSKQRGGNFLKGALQGAALGGATGMLGSKAAGRGFFGPFSGSRGIFGLGTKMLPNMLAMAGIGMGSEMLGQGEANKLRMQQTRRWLDDEEERRIARLSKIAGYDVADSANFMTPNKYFAAEGGMIARPGYYNGGISSMEDDPMDAVNIQELQMDPGTMGPGELTEDFDYMEAGSEGDESGWYEMFFNEFGRPPVDIKELQLFIDQSDISPTDVAARGGQGAMMAAEGGQVNRPGYAWGGSPHSEDPSGWLSKFKDLTKSQRGERLLADTMRANIQPYQFGNMMDNWTASGRDFRDTHHYTKRPASFNDLEDWLSKEAYKEDEEIRGRGLSGAYEAYGEAGTGSTYEGGGSVMGKDEYDEELNRPQYAPGGVADLDLRGGGASFGPGTGTSDDIPAMLSDGEFVVTANAVTNLGGGDRMLGAKRMYRMMNQLDPNSQTPAEMSGVGYA